eukprot:TRINITY_DN49111_c0_g1_i3.p1 TRINITY_DN49111_c0_g1~~TRINITY_DN49111_c0_g1_i3.p1  ORF type:complete len:503 (+),score=84.83 TRINITY_DN49111_c0_g1_i3:206-1714(+)
MSSSERSMFLNLALTGDTAISAAVGKRYLLGIDGFEQDFKEASQHLETAARQTHAGAMAMLGYMYCLGLGVPKNLDVAYSHFVAAAAQDDHMGHNGLGYLYFHGSGVEARDLSLAFKHFNISAHLGSADGMFNLASLYLTGTGTKLSFTLATMWFTKALDKGHTPAAYTLAVMHLNGIGTIRNCKMAVDLLKRVCERGGWLANQLKSAYDRQESRLDSSAWLFLKLAETGHEIAQMNVAYLLESRTSRLLVSGPEEPRWKATSSTAEVRTLSRVYAQRHYEMSAEQGNILADLRLGDYAYNGWGIRLQDFVGDGVDVDEVSAEGEASLAGIDSEADQFLEGYQEPLKFLPQAVDVDLALVHYRRTADMKVSGDWMQPFVMRANFNLGYMYHFGIGVEARAETARYFYRRCQELDPASVQGPVAVMSLLLDAQAWVTRMPSMEVVARTLNADLRSHILVLHMVAVVMLFVCRRRALRRRSGNAAADSMAGSNTSPGARTQTAE